MSLIAGAVDVDTVMARLSSIRRVFYSEAGFQHAFAWVLHEVEPSLNIRLEVLQDKREYVDYSMAWRAYAKLPGSAGDFRQLTLVVEQSAQGATRHQ